MRIYPSTICLLLSVSLSATCSAQDPPPVAADSAQSAKDAGPTLPLVFGTLAVKDGEFFVTEYEFRPVNEQVAYTYTVTVQRKEERTKELPDKSIVTYTVTVPVQETRQATRTVIRFIPESKEYPVPDEMIKISTIEGDPVAELKDFRTSLQQKSRPAVIMVTFDPAPLDAYYKKALSPQTVVLHLNPNAKNVGTYLQRGDEFYNNKEYGKAVAAYTAGSKVDPQNPQPYNYKAWRLATCPDETIRDGQAAVAAGKRAVELLEQSQLQAGNKAFVQRTLAAAYATAGDYSQAAKTMNVAIKTLPEDMKEQKEEFYRNQTLFLSEQPFIEVPDARIVVDSDGTNAFQATFVSADANTVTVKKLDGETIRLLLSRVSEGDQEWARQSAGK